MCSDIKTYVFRAIYKGESGEMTFKAQNISDVRKYCEEHDIIILSDIILLTKREGLFNEKNDNRF